MADLFVGLDTSGIGETGDYEGSAVQRGILVGGAAHLLGRVVEGPTEVLNPTPMQLEQTEHGAWKVVPDARLKLDILLLKSLFYWKVVPSLRQEQHQEAQRMKDLLSWLTKELSSDAPGGPFEGDLGDLRGDTFSDWSGDVQHRFVADFVAGLTDAEFFAWSRYQRDDATDADLAMVATSPVPPFPNPD